MPEDAMISSPADLSAIPDVPDTPDGVEAIGETEPISPDAEGSEVDIDALNDTGEPDEQEDPTPDNQVHEEEEAEEAQPVEGAAADPELPEGVRKGKDRNGKDGLWLTPQRYEQFHGAHKALREFEEIAGEPVTAKVFDTYNRAFLGQEKMYGDLLSGDPQAQAAVIQHFLSEGAQALENGDIGKDPIVSLAGTFYGTLKESHPSGYAALRMNAAKDLIEELYQEAASKGSKNLWDSTGHVALSLGLPYQKSDEMATFVAQATDPIVSLQKRNQELEAQLTGKQTTNQAAQFDSWRVDQGKQLETAVLDEAIAPALSEIQAAWAKIPGGKDAFQDLILNRLHSKVRETLRADTRFQERIKLLLGNARRATSAQRRSEIGAQIKQLHISRASSAVQTHRPEIEKFANRAFKEQNDATHQRRQVAAKRVAPGSGTPVKRSLVPTNGVDDFEFATPANLSRSMSDILR
jgi:hypothetical protein